LCCLSSICTFLIATQSYLYSLIEKVTKTLAMVEASDSQSLASTHLLNYRN
jgi:hypothetical protein